MTPRPRSGETDSPRRVLVVTHEASRTGAPRVAVLVTAALVARNYEVTVISRGRGPLIADFEAHAPTHLELLYRVRRRLWLLRGLTSVAWLADTLLALATLLLHPADTVYVKLDRRRHLPQTSAVAQTPHHSACP